VTLVGIAVVRRMWERSGADEHFDEAGLPGQRAGSCIVERRAIGLTLPGSLNSRRRVVPAALGVGPDRPSRAVHRERLCARQAITVHAL
jgi:hypothetical protein